MYTTRIHFIRIDRTLNNDRHISVVLWSVTLPSFKPYEILHFRRIMHDRTLPVFFGPFLIRECSSVHLPCTLRSLNLTNYRKFLVNGRRSDWFVTVRQSLLLIKCGFFFRKFKLRTLKKKILPLQARISIVALEKIVPCNPYKF